MSRPNTVLALVTAVVVALLGLTIWAVFGRDNTRTEAVQGPPLVADSGRPSEQAPTELTGLQEPPPSPETAGEVQPQGRDAHDKRVEIATRPTLNDAIGFLKRVLPDRFGTLTAADAAALTSLDLRGAQITDADLAQLAALPALEIVGLRGTAVTDAGLAHLRDVPRLKSLDLRGTKVSGAGISALPTYRLEELHLTNTQVSAEDLRSLPAIPNLHVFKLNGLKVGDDALASLDYLPSLQHLELDRTAITDDGVRGLLARNPNIRRIELRGTSVTEEAILEFAQAYPGVELVKN